MIKLKAIAECSIQLEKARIDASSEILFGILAHLIVERGRPVPRSTLAEYFWWNSEPREAGHCLRQSVYKLRQLGAPIETTREHYLLGERAALADFDCADERTLALSPLPAEHLSRALQGARRIIVVEQNHGAQLYHYLLGQKAIPPAAESVARPGPLPYRPSEIASYVA